MGLLPYSSTWTVEKSWLVEREGLLWGFGEGWSLRENATRVQGTRYICHGVSYVNSVGWCFRFFRRIRLSLCTIRRSIPCKFYRLDGTSVCRKLYMIPNSAVLESQHILLPSLVWNSKSEAKLCFLRLSWSRPSWPCCSAYLSDQALPIHAVCVAFHLDSTVQKTDGDCWLSFDKSLRIPCQQPVKVEGMLLVTPPWFYYSLPMSASDTVDDKSINVKLMISRSTSYSVVTVHGTGTFLGTNAFSECNFELFAPFFLS